MEPAFSETWGTILESVRQALAQAENDAARREEELAAALTSPEQSAAPEAGWQRCFEDVERSLERHRAIAEQAEQCAREADAALAEVEAGLRDWLANAGLHAA